MTRYLYVMFHHSHVSGAERTTRGLGELAEAAERYAGPGTLSNQRSSALRGRR